jgi:sialidase-1
MEPGVAECADGSIYMTIRTKHGCLYESRSRDGGQTWQAATAKAFVSPSAPSTVTRDPGSADLWLIWCNNPAGAKAGWADRNPQALVVSRDGGRTWGAPRLLENDDQRGFGYFSVDVVDATVHLTYYDWSKGQPNFYLTDLRQRCLPLAWMRAG